MTPPTETTTPTETAPVDHHNHAACTGELVPPAPAALAVALIAVPDWQLRDGQLHRTYVCSSFPESITFVAALADRAEMLNHHPDVRIENKREVRVTLWTRKLECVTALDVDLAAEFDAVYSRLHHSEAMTSPARVLTHLDESGAARMVDVSAKASTVRQATATAAVVLDPATLDLIISGTAPKGDVLAAARIAGILAAKRTIDLIPLCHPIGLDAVTVDLRPAPPDRLIITARATTSSRTGVEMEALAAAAIAALTVYDMCKSADRGMTVTDLCLQEKSGGRSGHWRR